MDRLFPHLNRDVANIWWQVADVLSYNPDSATYGDRLFGEISGKPGWSELSESEKQLVKLLGEEKIKTSHEEDEREVTFTDIRWVIRLGDGFAAGLGLAMALLMGQYLTQAMTLRKAVVKEVIICRKCAARNPVEYTYCSNCGQRLYPLHITCQQCQAENPVMMNFCGTCGIPLKKALDQ